MTNPGKSDGLLDRLRFKSIGNAFWAILDQGLFATSNFALNILLARWLPVQEYGSFAIAFAVFTLIGTFHTGLLSEPMLVFGSEKYRSRFQEYLGALALMHAGFGIVCCLALVVCALLFSTFVLQEMLAVFVAFALAGPLILLLWLVRRACYASTDGPRLAAFGGGIYVVVMLAGAYLLSAMDRLSASSATYVMGVSSLLVALWIFMKLGVRRPTLKNDFFSGVIKDHWKYGRWSMMTQVLTWAPMHVYYLILPIWSGLSAAAGLRALINLILPSQQAIIALATYLLPTLTRARGEARFGKIVNRALLAFNIGTIGYWLCLSLFSEPIISFLYGGRYDEYAGLIWILALLPVSAGVVQVFAAALRSQQEPRLVFRGYFLSTAIALSIGLPAAALWGASGAVFGMLAYSATTAAGMTYLYYKYRGDFVKLEL